MYETDYVVANDTAQIPFEVEFGNGTSYTPSDVWDANNIGVYKLNNVSDSSSNSNTATNQGSSFVDGYFGNGADFEESEHDEILLSAGNTMIPNSQKMECFFME